jgi:prepilin peptidase CpaA
VGETGLWPVLILVGLATFTDLRSRRIPNWLTLPFLIAGIVAGGLRHGLPGAVRSFEGAGLAMLLLAAPCFLRGIAWGDLKLCVAVGAWIGPGRLILALVMMGVAGGTMALAALAVCGLRHEAQARLTLDDAKAFKLPYAPAIAFGTLIAWLAN